MANLNLSQFTEKLFVADADHTFIWDTVGAISKRVSRNSWLNSGTLTSDAPVTISQTWNNAAVAFTGLKVNAVSTASDPTSKLLDLQVGGVSKFSLRKDGHTELNSINLAGGAYGGDANWWAPAGLNIAGTSYLSFGAADVRVVRDGAANTLALRNGANGQTFSVYGTYPGAAWERFTITAPTSGNVLLGTYKGTGGIARGLELQTDGVTRITVGAAGGVTVTGVTTSSGGFSATGLGFGCLATGFIYWASSTTMSAPSDGLLKITNTAGNDFNRIQFGGTSSAFPALKRSTTYLQARLADDSAFAPIQGKLTTDTAYTGTVVAATGYITIYDSTGAAYRVPCAV